MGKVDTSCLIVNNYCVRRLDGYEDEGCRDALNLNNTFSLNRKPVSICSVHDVNGPIVVNSNSNIQC